MKILKDSKKLKTESPLVDKYDYIVLGLKESMSYIEIAKSKDIKMPTLQKQTLALFRELENIEPKITKLWQEFDVYLDLKEVVEPFWINIVKRIVILRNQSVFVSPLDINLIVTKKLYHKVNNITPKKPKKPYTAISVEFLKPFGKEIPCRVEDVAKELDVDASKLQYIIDRLFFEKIIMIDGWLLALRTSIFKSMVIYGSSDKIFYEGTLRGLYEMFNKKYSKLFKKHKAKTYDDFIIQVKKKIDIFSFVGVSVDGEYENRRYLKKNSIKEVKHHLKK